MTILILILAPWLSAVVLVLAACHGASAGEAQLQSLTRESRAERRPLADHLDRASL